MESIPESIARVEPKAKRVTHPYRQKQSDLPEAMPVWVAAYTAGLFDGEGCISNYTELGYRGAQVVCSITQTTHNRGEELCRWFAEQWKMGRVYFEPAQGRCDSKWVWVIGRYWDVRFFLGAVLPMLMVKETAARKALRDLDNLSQYRRKWHDLICAWCQKPFQRRPADYRKSTYKDADFCGHSCGAKYAIYVRKSRPLAPRVNLECQWCGIKFRRKKSEMRHHPSGIVCCCRSHAAKLRVARGICPKAPSNRVDLTCSFCGLSFSRPASNARAKSGIYYCSIEHRWQAHRGEVYQA